MLNTVLELGRAFLINTVLELGRAFFDDLSVILDFCTSYMLGGAGAAIDPYLGNLIRQDGHIGLSVIKSL